MGCKFKNILLTSILAVAGIFGVSSAIINNKVNEQPVVEKAEASNTFMFINLYADTAGTNSWTHYPMTEVSDTVYATNLEFSNGGKFTICFKWKDDGNGDNRWVGYKFIDSSETDSGWPNTNVSEDVTYTGSSTRTFTITVTNPRYNFNKSNYDADVAIAGNYTVTFDKNSGTGGTDSVTAVKRNDMPSATAPTRTGYTFGGYYDGEGGTGTQYYTSSMESAKEWDKTDDTDLYAKWTISSHSLSWNFAGGSTSATSSQYTQAGTYNYGTSITYPANNTMSRTGYTFNGWNSSATTIPDNDLTITALWNANTYNITYKDRGNVTYSGSNSASLLASYTYDTSTALISGVKSGYLFKGWYDNSACSGDAITNVGDVADDITLYAKFVKQPSTSPVFVLVGNEEFNLSMGGSASSPTWEYFTSAQEMRDTPGDNQQAAKNNVILRSGSYLKFTKYHDGDYDGIWAHTAIDMQGTWAGTYLEQSGSDIVVKTEGNGLYYSFYVGNDNTLHVYPSHHTVHMKGVFVRGNTSTTESSDLTPATPINGVALHAQTYTAPTSSWNYTYGGVSYTFDSWYTDEDLTTPYTSTNNVTSDITIYAKFVDLNNYITYNHNDGSGITQLVDPSHLDTSYTVRSYSGLTWNDKPWEDSFFRSFANWNTEANGSGTRYDPGDSISVSSATTLYAQQNWHQVYISVDNGSTWHATKTTFPSGMQIQYETTEKLIVDSDTARIKLKYHNVNTGADVILNNGDISFEGNNYNAETGGVNVSFTDCIFLKVKNDNTLQCYIPGASTRTLLIKHASGGETAISLQYDNETQWSSLGYVYMRAGDKIWARYMTESAYKSWYMSGDGCEGDAEGVATCVTTGAYKVYLQRGNPENWKDIVVSRNELESAAYYARLFNSQMGTICAGYNTNTAASFIDAWQKNASENAVTVFGELSSTCKTGLIGTTYDADSDVAAFKAKYDYILGKYGYGTGSGELRDFLGRTPAPSFAIRDFSPLSLFGEEDNLSTVIIIAASSVALLSVTALSILVIKKRKNKEE